MEIIVKYLDIWIFFCTFASKIINYMKRVHKIWLIVISVVVAVFVGLFIGADVLVSRFVQKKKKRLPNDSLLFFYSHSNTQKHSSRLLSREQALLSSYIERNIHKEIPSKGQHALHKPRQGQKQGDTHAEDLGNKGQRHFLNLCRRLNHAHKHAHSQTYAQHGERHGQCQFYGLTTEANGKFRSHRHLA